ncbi:unnamed protein product [Diamesa serratosioi]
MIVLPFVPILALILQTLFNLNEVIIYRNEVSEIESQVQVATDLGKLVTRLQLERGEVAFFIYTNGSLLRANLTERFIKTDSAIENMSSWDEIVVPASPNGTEEEGEIMLNKTSFQLRLNDFRSQINSTENSVIDVMLWYMAVNNAMLDHLTKQIKESDKSGVWRYLIGFKNLLKGIECIGVSAVYGINYYGRGYLKQDRYINYLKYDVLGKDLLNSSLNYVPSLKKVYKNLTNSMPNYGRIKNRKVSLTIALNANRQPNVDDAIKYYDSMTSYIEKLRQLHTELRKEIKNEVKSFLDDASEKEAIGIGILVTVLFVSPIIIILVRNAVATIQLYSMNLAKKAKELKNEKRKSDSLLFQMLPTSVAIKLKQTHQVPAEYYESVTIYFSDIVGFTEIASFCSPLEVVSFLNSIYRVFDERIECYDVYKVETIGDAYMVCSGLPVRNGKKHVSEISTMALDLLHASSYFKVPHRSNETIQIRSGIHTGSCGAGIVGTKMPRYCLFGDTVNTASRMESTSEAFKIHITSEVNDELQLIGGFKTEPRGLIDVKGKGSMETFWLLGHESHQSLNNLSELHCDEFFLASVLEPEFLQII